MIYIIVHKTSECYHPYITDILFTSTDENMAKKIFDKYRELSRNENYDDEVYILYEYPEMNTMNYPYQDIGTIIDIISYE